MKVGIGINIKMWLLKDTQCPHIIIHQIIVTHPQEVLEILIQEILLQALQIEQELDKKRELFSSLTFFIF